MRRQPISAIDYVPHVSSHIRVPSERQLIGMFFARISPGHDSLRPPLEHFTPHWHSVHLNRRVPIQNQIADFVGEKKVCPNGQEQQAEENCSHE
jgi:hypothetical protein